ncbi:Alpha/beta hydrolase fold-1 [Stachybotrys elegans]|uniref:Alpha/beta hydrolase fold-1 n=1 Tax=Stachybotrys elegans TaxID=80388 RepID=A0A8K0SIM4_9HYPO|nr:Alpha/beta hydrolase fold-1 [Stachybotrys elegans]
MANDLPTLVIVPGSFGPVSLYADFADTLLRHGVKSKIVDTPSVGRRPGLAPGTMSDDVDEIVRVVAPLLDQGLQVVLLTHSYGGIPGTQSLEKLSRKAREAQGKQGGVEKIVYLSSVVLQVGVCNLDLFGPNLPTFVTLEDDYMHLDAEASAPLTFSDLPPEEALRLAKQMPDHSTSSFREKLTYAGYNDVDVYYIVCEEDKIIPPEGQQGMIQFLKSTGKDVGVFSMKCGHCPVSSQPENLSKIITDIL